MDGGIVISQVVIRQIHGRISEVTGTGLMLTDIWKLAGI